MADQPRDRVAEGIARWAAVRPDLDPSGTEIVGRVLRLGAIFRETLSAVLERRGLGLGDYSVLAILRSRGGPSGELPPKALAEATYVTSGGMTNLVKRLESNGLVARRPDPGDGRGTLVRITDAGRALIDSVVTDVSEAERTLVRGLPEAGRQRLADSLSDLLQAIDRPSKFPTSTSGR
jgi:DNA-binding MarR family transcriptional regulator